MKEKPLLSKPENTENIYEMTDLEHSEKH